jgi:O-antigen/teichoic acid export membrane protein
MRRSVIAGGTVMALVFVLVEVCGLARIALFARAVDPAAMGAIVVMGAWLRLVEMATDLSLDRYLMRIARHEADSVRNAAHGAALLRGAAGAALMSLSIMALLSIYDLGEAAPALMLMVLLPLVRGFIHYDYRIENRFLNLWPAIQVEAAGAFAGLAAAVAGVLTMPGPFAFAVSLAVQALVSLVASHALARDRYAVSFDRTLFGQFWAFGWPLTINAMLLYAVFQGERLIVAGLTGLDAVAAFSIASQIALLPVMIAGRLALGIALPAISTVRGDSRQSEAAERVTLAIFAAAGWFFWLSLTMLAGKFIGIVFGHAYLPGETELVLIAAAAAIRLQKTGLSTVLLGRNQSRDILSGSLARLAAMAAGTVALAYTGNLALFIAASAAGELASHEALCRRVNQSAKIVPPGLRCAPLLVVLPTAGLVYFPDNPAVAVPLATAASLVTAILLLPLASRLLSARVAATAAASKSIA